MIDRPNTLNQNDSVAVRTIFLVVGLLAMSNQSFAEGENTFGVMIGANASGLSGYDGESLVSFTGGLYWEWRYSEKFSLQSDILYSQRGEKGNDTTSDLKLNYLNMPIMLKYYVTEDFQVMGGIYWDELLGTDSDIYSEGDFKESDVGIPIGISYKFSKNLQLGLSYNFGLSNVSNSDLDLENHWGNMTITYIFK